MFYSKKTVSALLFTCAILCGCSQSDDVIDTTPSTSVEQEGEASIVFRFQTNTSNSLTTRAAAESTAEDSYEHIQGTPDEYKVENARVYLFDAPTKLFVKSMLLTKLTRVGSDTQGNIVYETEHVTAPSGTYDIFVTANTDRMINKKTEDEFLADIDSLTYARALIDDISKGIVMTNRANENLSTVIEDKEGREDNIVTVSLERVLARIDIAKSDEAYKLTDKAGNVYATATLDKYYIVNLAKYYYSFRHTAVLNSMDIPTWKVSENFGMVNDVNGYVIDPYFFNKTIDATRFTNADKYYVHYFGDFNNAIGWTDFKTAGSEQANYNTIYCLENCMLWQAQKNGYSTGVVFTAKFEPYSVYRLASNGELEQITDKSQYPERLYYYNYGFYDSADALKKAIGIDNLTTISMDVYQVRQFEKGEDGYRCYYNYWIRHLDNHKPTVMGVMEFGIVRNNLYRLRITNVADLGQPNLHIDPDTPDEGEALIKVVLNVKPWIVRDLTNIVL